MKKAKSHQNKFVRIILMPLRALGKAKDYYVSKMTDYAGRSNFAGGMMGGAAAANYGNLPRSFSAASSSRSNSKSEDYSELIRAASARSIPPDSIDMNVFLQQQQIRKQAAAAETIVGGGGGLQKMPPRSVSVGMGRIDEDKACLGFEEEEDEVDITAKQKIFYPRSKSYAVTNNKTSLVL